jgi:hypothetical protein
MSVFIHKIFGGPSFFRYPRLLNEGDVVSLVIEKGLGPAQQPCHQILVYITNPETVRAFPADPEATLKLLGQIHPSYKLLVCHDGHASLTKYYWGLGIYRDIPLNTDDGRRIAYAILLEFEKAIDAGQIIWRPNAFMPETFATQVSHNTVCWKPFIRTK